MSGDLTASRKRAREILADPKRLAQLIRDVGEVETMTGDEFRAKYGLPVYRRAAGWTPPEGEKT